MIKSFSKSRRNHKKYASDAHPLRANPSPKTGHKRNKSPSFPIISSINNTATTTTTNNNTLNRIGHRRNLSRHSSSLITIDQPSSKDSLSINEQLSSKKDDKLTLHSLLRTSNALHALTQKNKILPPVPKYDSAMATKIEQNNNITNINNNNNNMSNNHNINSVNNNMSSYNTSDSNSLTKSRKNSLATSLEVEESISSLRKPLRSTLSQKNAPKSKRDIYKRLLKKITALNAFEKAIHHENEQEIDENIVDSNINRRKSLLLQSNTADLLLNKFSNKEKILPSDEQKIMIKFFSDSPRVTVDIFNRSLKANLIATLQDRCVESASCCVTQIDEFIGTAKTVFRNIILQQQHGQKSMMYNDSIIQGWKIIETTDIIFVLAPKHIKHGRKILSNNIKRLLNNLAYQVCLNVTNTSEKLKFNDNNKKNSHINNNEHHNNNNNNQDNFVDPILIEYSGFTTMACRKPCNLNKILPCVNNPPPNIDIMDWFKEAFDMPIDLTFRKIVSIENLNKNEEEYRRYRPECMLILYRNANKWKEVHTLWKSHKFSEACHKLIASILLPEIVRDLHNEVNSGKDANKINFAEFFHIRGMNCRYLGYIRSQCTKNKNLRDAMLIQIIGRSIKSILRGWLSNCDMTTAKIQLSHSHCISMILNLITEKHPDSKQFWNVVILDRIQQKFGRQSLSNVERLDLFSAVDTLKYDILQFLSDHGCFSLNDTCHLDQLTVFHSHCVDIHEPTIKFDVWTWQVRAFLQMQLIWNRKFNSRTFEEMSIVNDFDNRMDAIVSALLHSLKWNPLNITLLADLVQFECLHWELQCALDTADKHLLNILLSIFPSEERKLTAFCNNDKFNDQLNLDGFDLHHCIQLHDTKVILACLISRVLYILESRCKRFSYLPNCPTTLDIILDIQQIIELSNVASHDMVKRIEYIFQLYKHTVIEFVEICIEPFFNEFYNLKDIDTQNIVEWLCDAESSPSATSYTRRFGRINNLFNNLFKTCDINYNILDQFLIDRIAEREQLDWIFVMIGKALYIGEHFYIELMLQACLVGNLHLFLYCRQQQYMNEILTPELLTNALINVCCKNDNLEYRIEIIRNLVKSGASINGNSNAFNNLSPKNFSSSSSSSSSSSTTTTTTTRIKENEISMIGDFFLPLTPIHRAAMHGSVKMIELLLKLGCSLFVDRELSAIDTAVLRNNTLTVIMMLKNISPEFLKDNLNRAIRLAAYENRFELLLQLLNNFSKDSIDLNSLDCIHFQDSTPLILASGKGHIDSCKILVEHSANINDCNSDGYSPSMFACVSGNCDLLLMLLNSKANVNQKSNCGSSLLHIACEAGNIKIVESLLSFDSVDINVTDSHGKTPLVNSIINKQEHVVELLLERKADCDIEVESAEVAGNHKCVLWFAVMSGHKVIADRLMKQCKKPSEKWKSQTLLEAVEFGELNAIRQLIRMKVKVNTRGDKNRTPIMVAASNGEKDIIKILLAAKADPRLYDDMGYNAQHLATINGHDHVANYLMKRLLRRDSAISDESTMAISDNLTKSKACMIM